LADYQAVQVSYAELIAEDRNAVLNHYDLTTDILEYTSGNQEKVASWLSQPAVKSLLVSLILLAIFTEIKTAGVGVAAFVGLVAAALFFGSQWLIGAAVWLEVILFLSGIILVAVEIFVPGFGLFGIGGIICILLSFFLVLGGNAVALNLLVLSLIVAIIVFIVLLKFLPSSMLWSKLVLKESETKKAGFSSSQDYSSYLGKEGVVVRHLRPSGMVVIEGVQIDVVSEGQYVEPGVKVKVIQVSGSRIVVRPVDE
jgi:membrane-bound serine protease (ClpP class)